MKTGVKVMDAMTHAPVVVKPSETLQKCAKLMLKRKLGNVLVIKKEKLIGIVTEKDLIRSVIAKNLDPKKTLVEDIMTKKPKTISPNKDIVKAMQHMQTSKIRRLPVVFKGNVIGIITDKDIIKLQPAILELVAGRKTIMQKKEKYIEGICESCENYAQLHENNGKYICAECLNETS
ncbi:CBS domain-containing protein [archaeon]|nr:CBS domain-containing protein [archaeon]|tara:strand:+ start:314 stop:844 length:531 start_codon:yes stop_codon:yes gene_type:complete